MRTTAEIREWRVNNPGQRLVLEGADLRGANLRGAYLRGAYLQGVIGLYFPSLMDPRGYTSYVKLVAGSLLWGAGCRLLTLEEAAAHWGEAYDGERAIGDRYVRAIRDLRTDTGFIQWLMKEQAAQRATE